MSRRFAHGARRISGGKFFQGSPIARPSLGKRGPGGRSPLVNPRKSMLAPQWFRPGLRWRGYVGQGIDSPTFRCCVNMGVVCANRRGFMPDDVHGNGIRGSAIF